jgi:hypothetical protein
MTRLIITSSCFQVIGCAADGHHKQDRTKASADVSATKFTVTPISCSGALRSPTTDKNLHYYYYCYYYYYMVYSTAREPCRWPLTNLVAS